MAGPRPTKKYYPRRNKTKEHFQQTDTNTIDIEILKNAPAVEAGGGSFNSPTTTKGDLIVRDATQDVRFPVGVNGAILVADSAEAEGLRWESGTLPEYIELVLGVTQNVGGANGTQHKFTWTTQNHIDTAAFSHDTVTNNDQITINKTGWYTIHHNFFATQTGANRTVQIGRLWVDTVIDPKFLPTTYGRGATFGLYIGYQATYRKFFNAGEVIEIGVQVSDPDATYVTNASSSATYVQIVADPASLAGPQGLQGVAGAPGGVPTSIADTGTVIDVDELYGSICNAASPNTNTIFTLGTTADNGFARVFIDTTGVIIFPSVTGATLISGHAFEAAYIYEMFLEHIGTTTYYSFVKRNPA